MLNVALQFWLQVQQLVIQNLNILGSFLILKYRQKVARTLSRFKVRCKWFSLVGADYKYSFFSNDNKNKNAEQITTEGPAAVS